MYHFKNSFRDGCQKCGHPISAHRAEGEVITTPGFVKDYRLFPWDSYSIKDLYASSIDGKVWDMVSVAFDEGCSLRKNAFIKDLVSDYFDCRIKFSKTILSTHKKTRGNLAPEAIWTVLPTSVLRRKYEGAS